MLAPLGCRCWRMPSGPALLSEPDPRADPRRYATWLDSRPPAAETRGDRIADRAVATTRARACTSCTSPPQTRCRRSRRRARAGVPITVETCPHYLTFCAEDIADGDTAFKCAPPIRERDHRERLWRALADGVIDLVATDHSPAPPALKHVDDGDFVAAWGGIASLQIALPVVWTGAAARGHPARIALARVDVRRARAARRSRRRARARSPPGSTPTSSIFDPDREMHRRRRRGSIIVMR